MGLFTCTLRMPVLLTPEVLQMIKRAKYVLFCVLTGALSVILTAVLDSFTGVPFNYALPLALMLALIPHTLLLRSNHQTVPDPGADETAQGRTRTVTASGRAGVNPRTQTLRPGSTRTAKIHSIIFAP
jgi:hypothetical protein